MEEGERAPPTVKVRSIEAVEQEITAERLPSYKTEAFYTADTTPLLVSSYFSAFSGLSFHPPFLFTVLECWDGASPSC